MNEHRKLLLEVGALVDRVTTLLEELESISDYAEGAITLDKANRIEEARLREHIERIAQHADTGIRLCRRTLDEFHS